MKKLILPLVILTALATFAFGATEAYLALVALPSEEVTAGASASSIDLSSAITDRAKPVIDNPTVVASVKFSGAAADTCVVTCVLYFSSDGGTTLQTLGLQTSTATAGTYVDAPAATQVTAAGGRTITYNENTPAADSVVASSGSFITDNFQAGMTLVIVGSTSNDGSYTLATVTALTLTLIAADDLADEGPINATDTLDANGYFYAPLVFFDLAGATHYEIRHAAPSSGNIDITSWGYGASSQ